MKLLFIFQLEDMVGEWRVIGKIGTVRNEEKRLLFGFCMIGVLNEKSES